MIDFTERYKNRKNGKNEMYGTAMTHKKRTPKCPFRNHCPVVRIRWP